MHALRHAARAAHPLGGQGSRGQRRQQPLAARMGGPSAGIGAATHHQALVAQAQTALSYTCSLRACKWRPGAELKYSRHQARQVAAAAAPGSTQEPGSDGSSSAYVRTVLPTALALLLCNMDRICLSVAMLPIAQELGWAAGTQGVVQSAFLWGYLATQLLGGTLADRYGGKLVMGAGIAWFSLASALLPGVAITPWTAAAGLTLPAVMAARFLVGFGEGVALPSMNNLIARNIDPSKKATALGNVFTGFHTGNLVGLLLSPLILQRFGWRALFYFFGLAGAPLLLLWVLVVPSGHSTGSSSSSSGGAAAGPAAAAGAAAAVPAAVPAPAAGGSKVGIGRLLSKHATWAIIVANFVNHWGYFIYLNWMPTYFYKVLGMDLRASSLMSFVPWVVMAVGSTCAGLLADGLVRRGVPVLRVRKGIQTAAFLGPVFALSVLSNPTISPSLALLCMTAALGITSLGQAGFVANMSDIAPRHAGLLFGLCNTFGSFAGILGVSVCGFVLERTGSFSLIFQATAALYVLGTAFWITFCQAEPQFE